jgi:hypothetical protein
VPYKGVYMGDLSVSVKNYEISKDALFNIIAWLSSHDDSFMNSLKRRLNNIHTVDDLAKTMSVNKNAVLYHVITPISSGRKFNFSYSDDNGFSISFESRFESSRDNLILKKINFDRVSNGLCKNKDAASQEQINFGVRHLWSMLRNNEIENMLKP